MESPLQGNTDLTSLKPSPDGTSLFPFIWRRKGQETLNTGISIPGGCGMWAQRIEVKPESLTRTTDFSTVKVLSRIKIESAKEFSKWSRKTSDCAAWR